MNAIHNTRTPYQVHQVNEIATNILSFFKFRFNSHPVPMIVPSDDVFLHILTANSPVEMVLHLSSSLCIDSLF